MHRSLCRIAFIVIALSYSAVYSDESVASRLPGEPQVHSFSMAEYQSNVQNWAVETGSDGLVYVGGGMGLLEYNGVSWTRHDTPNNSRVRRLLIDNQGRFWIGSSNQFGYFQREPDGAMRYHSLSDTLPEDQRTFGDIRGLVEVDGTLYFQALRSLFRFDGETLDRIEAWDGVFRILLKHQNRVLVAVRSRLHDVTEFSGTTPPPINRWSWPQGARLTFLEPWPDGRILAGTYADGLYWLSDAPPERFRIDFDLSEAWPFVIERRADGTILLGTRHNGLLHIGAAGALLEHVSSRNGLPKDVINAIGEDRQGGIWLPQDGFITRVALDAPMRTWGAASGLSSARGMTRHNGQLLVAGASGIGRLQAVTSDHSQLIALDSPLIEAWDILSAEGELLAAGSEGVHRLDYDLSSDELIEHQRLLADHYGYRLTPSRFRSVIYAQMESGLSLLLLDNGRWIDAGPVAGIDERPHHVAEDKDGRVWVGTVQGRFYLLEWHEQAAELSMLTVLDGDDGVPEGYAWPFALADRLVLGTSQGGYRAVYGDDGQVVAVEPDPAFNNQALGESRSIYKLASPDGVRVLGGIGNGGALRFGWLDAAGEISWQPHPVPGIEVGQNDFIVADDDAVWIGRAPGMVRLGWPVRDQAQQSVPLHIGRVGYPETDGWLRNGPGELAQLAQQPLPFQNSLLRFEYALTGYAQPDAHRYRVRLDGMDDDWSQWSIETRRDYTNLPGGNYLFHAQARDGRGLISSATPLAFSIAPPWYLGTPMLVMYVALALLLLWLAARYGRFRRERVLITRQRELEDEIAERTTEVRRQAREIRQISDARATFFANVSHELRTPLTLTRAPLEELGRDAESLSKNQRDHLNMALRNTEAMQSLIGQVLDLHRLDAGHMPFNPVQADIAAALESIVSRFRLAARSRNLQLKLAGIDEPCAANFDPEHLATMVSNLLSNALKFAPRDSAIQVQLLPQRDGTGITVSDQGPGINSTDQARIFERYQQAESTVAGGSGIGLALVRDLIEMHGGNVTVASQPGHGACFKLWLPWRSDSAAQSTQAEQATRTASTDDNSFVAVSPAVDETVSPDDQTDDASGDWPTVLIVDDNTELRAFLRLRLGRAYRIIEAGNGREGLALVQTHLPDVVVTDGMMPELDGLGMTEAIKSDPETDFIPVLMLTARGGPDAVIRGMQAGADDYLGKPFDSAELAARIAGLIASRRRLRERLAAADKQQAGNGSAPVSNQDPFLTRARTVVSEHLAEPGFSVRDWAALLYMDRTTLFRRFKAAAGCSPDEELREMRLQRAANLLRQRAGNVAEVADAVGFASVSAFSRRFRERFAATPAAFARKDTAIQ